MAVVRVHPRDALRAAVKAAVALAAFVTLGHEGIRCFHEPLSQLTKIHSTAFPHRQQHTYIGFPSNGR